MLNRFPVQGFGRMFPLRFPLVQPDRSGFNVLSLPSLAGWWDASDLGTLFQDNALTTPVTASGQPVGGWLDKSGNSRHLLQVGAAGTRPLYSSTGMNTRPCLAPDGTDDYLAAIGFTVAQPWTVFYVYQRTAAAVRTLMDSADGGVTTSRIRLTTGGTVYQMVAGATLSGGTADGTAAALCAQFNGASSFLEKDGVSVLSGNAGTNSLNGLTAFAQNGGAVERSGNPTSEIIICGAALDAATRAATIAYLRAKWGTP